MTVQVISTDAEKSFFQFLERYQREGVKRCYVFHCELSQAFMKAPPAHVVMAALEEYLEQHNIATYSFDDGDLMVTWDGNSQALAGPLKQMIAQYLLDKDSDIAPDGLSSLYDTQTHGERLRSIITAKMSRALVNQGNNASVAETKKGGELNIAFSPAQLKNLLDLSYERPYRKRPEVLIVEDKAFTQKLLGGVLHKICSCHKASDGAEAIEKYTEVAPDIVFLDIELPDSNGHDLAKLIKDNDPTCFIVMVTGNNYSKDIKRASENGVEGFIVKPFNKAKILEAYEKYAILHGKHESQKEKTNGV